MILQLEAKLLVTLQKSSFKINLFMSTDVRRNFVQTINFNVQIVNKQR